ncbi:MAG TPA: hypothetical protein VMT34_06310 [Aggregatilineales bacterium]|nr:hypothetical protein [Aggregatilineales bacterium]
MTAHTTSTRFRDDGSTIYRMLDEILVVCPRCQSCARIAILTPGDRDWFAPRRLTCRHCGHARDWAERQIARYWGRPAVDDFFHEPLWLQTPCGNEILWAYNLKHLTLLERYVGASLREHRRGPDGGWQNSALVNRLPRWISSAKNRAAVLKTLQKLRGRYRE